MGRIKSIPGSVVEGFRPIALTGGWHTDAPVVILLKKGHQKEILIYRVYLGWLAKGVMIALPKNQYTVGAKCGISSQLPQTGGEGKP